MRRKQPLPSAATWHDLPATFTIASVRGKGIHPNRVYDWRDAGVVIELASGVFRRADAPWPEHPDLLAIRHRMPAFGIVCGQSAAYVHKLLDRPPPIPQVAIPDDRQPLHDDQPSLRLMVVRARFHEIGTALVDAAPGEPVPVYNGIRTVLDLVVADDPAAGVALRRVLSRPSAADDLRTMATTLGPMTVAALERLFRFGDGYAVW